MRPIYAMLLLFAAGCSIRTPGWEWGSGKPPMVAVHVESQWEGAERVAEDVAKLASGRKVYMLISAPGDWRSATLIPSVRPVKVLLAPGGEWEGLSLPGATVEFCGGYFRGCLANAVAAVVRRSPGVTVVFPLRCVYHGPSRTLEEVLKDNWRDDVAGFLRYIERVSPDFGFSEVEVTLEKEKLVLRDLVI